VVEKFSELELNHYADLEIDQNRTHLYEDDFVFSKFDI